MCSEIMAISIYSRSKSTGRCIRHAGRTEKVELSFVGGKGISNSMMILTSARVVGGIGKKGGAEALLFPF